MKKKKIKGVFPVSCALFVLCFFFFPDFTGKELVLVPSWIMNVEQETVVHPRERNDIFAFRLNDKFGYANLNGELCYRDTIQYNVTLSAKGFINYSSIQTEDQNLVFFDQVGGFINSYQMAGYPLLSRDGKRLFLIHTNGSGIREVDESGSILWRSDFAKQITTMAISDELVCLGFANGLLQLYNQKGECVYEFMPKKSRIPIILGCALNKNGTRIAAVYGIDPQYLIYIEKREKKYLNPFFYELSADFRREVFLEFSPDSSHLMIESDQKLLAFSLKSRKMNEIPLEGDFLSYMASLNCDFFTVISRGDSLNTLLICKPDMLPVIKVKFKADYIFDKLIDNHFIIGVDNRLVRLDLLEL